MKRTRRIACTLLLLLACSACGVRGPLVKKGAALPLAPTDGALQQQGSDLLLSWSVPTGNQDGSPLTDLVRFDIYRLPYRPGDYCPECRDSSVTPIQIYLDRPAPAVRSDNHYILRDPGLSVDSGYRYRIVAINSDEGVGKSLLLHHDLLAPPPAPTGIVATPRDRSLQLAWAAAPQGTTRLGVNIYRAGANQPFGFEPINSEPVSALQYEDFGLSNGTRYFYRLRSVIQVDGQSIESDWSEMVEATPSSDF